MEYQNLKFKKINKEDCEITRYNDEVVLSKQCGVQFSPLQIKKVTYQHAQYSRDGQDVEIPWLTDRLLTAYEFYDDDSRERITLISFKNENGDIEYGFTDHND